MTGRGRALQNPLHGIKKRLVTNDKRPLFRLKVTTLSMSDLSEVEFFFSSSLLDLAWL